VSVIEEMDLSMTEKFTHLLTLEEQKELLFGSSVKETADK